ncbi:hypothetical protein CDAR_502371 [Caerostris darwini]|uniref:Uncharacterized protein n=2 Tax=Caerostris darwini TaxID=1538125 RepID=A0AAV4TD85_9ARAC|nr:hypothetical protein CDAR_446791 [Caerostris darwini]GIY43164.1 hypothetical protein CDAR_502371 [Caerostris darwini]
MLDSLVRVSRRVGWVTDLLAANRQHSDGSRATNKALRPQDHEASPCVRSAKESSATQCPASANGGGVEAREGLRDTTVGSRAMRRDG